MSITEKFKECCRFIKNKMLWVILIPALMDIANLLIWERMFHKVYIPAEQIISFKIGVTGTPPSINYLLQDFPSVLIKNDANVFSGIFTRLNLYNISLLLSIILISSFLVSGYMGTISLNSLEKSGLRKFFIDGNKRWHKFFIMNLITTISICLILINRDYMFIYFAFVIFFYVPYSFVADNVGVIQNFKLGISFLFNHLGITVRMALVVGIIFSFLSFFAFIVVKIGTLGIIIDILIFSFLGAAVNRMVYEVYTDPQI
ncbi:MAG: hypothetical protein ACM3X7_13285 [Solirubrobacterales bacterium]